MTYLPEDLINFPVGTIFKGDITDNFYTFMGMEGSHPVFWNNTLHKRHVVGYSIELTKIEEAL